MMQKVTQRTADLTGSKCNREVRVLRNVPLAIKELDRLEPAWQSDTQIAPKERALHLASVVAQLMPFVIAGFVIIIRGYEVFVWIQKQTGPDPAVVIECGFVVTGRNSIGSVRVAAEVIFFVKQIQKCGAHVIGLDPISAHHPGPVLSCPFEVT